jgi:hypothetical protein
MPEFLGTASSADNKAVKCPKYHEVQAMQIPSSTGEANRVIAVKACNNPSRVVKFTATIQLISMYKRCS